MYVQGSGGGSNLYLSPCAWCFTVISYASSYLTSTNHTQLYEEIPGVSASSFTLVQTVNV